MWDLNEPKPVKLIMGLLGADHACLKAAVDRIQSLLGDIDLSSDIWPFDQTDYYRRQTGDSIQRQFISMQALLDPGRLAAIKHQTNQVERDLAASLAGPLPRPVNIDPGYIEPSKLVLATTKNYSHRLYIGDRMYAEVTLIFDKGQWDSLPYTYPDYRQAHYHQFFNKVRARLLEQLRGQQ
jgi:hypothetical protein